MVQLARNEMLIDQDGIGLHLSILLLMQIRNCIYSYCIRLLVVRFSIVVVFAYIYIIMMVKQFWQCDTLGTFIILC